MAVGSASARGSQRILAALAMAALIACGGESEAANRTGSSHGNGGAAASANLTQTNRARTPASVRLPIQPGLYVSAYRDGGCAGATEIFFYDGQNFGDVRTNEEFPGNDGPSSTVERITHVGPPRKARLTPEFAAASRGFTLVWTMDQADDEPSPGQLMSAAFAVRAREPGGFERLRSGGNRIISYDEEPYQGCTFAQLSPQMQAAIRNQRPQLAGANATATTATRVTFPPIPQGYYARGRDCRAVLAEAARGEGEDLYLFNQRGLRDFMGWTTVVSAFEPLGGNRHRARARVFDENDNPTNADFTIAVTSGSSFTIEATADAPAERYTHCPDNQVPRGVREGYEF